MRSHIDNVLPNLEFIVGTYKEKHGGELKGVDTNTASAAYRYLLKGNCGSLGLVTLDDLARDFDVEISRFFLPLGEPRPREKYFVCAFPNNLQYYRKKARWSFSSLAREAGLGFGNSIKNYETCKSVPALDIVQNLADAFGIEVLELFKLNTKLWKEAGIIE